MSTDPEDGVATDLPRPPSAPEGRVSGMSAGKLGMFLFLVALGMLFAASMVGYLVVRLRAPSWPPAGSPRLPGGLWISTLVLLASSLTIHLAVRSARAGMPGRTRNWLGTTTLLGLAFLVSQILNWAHLVLAQNLPVQANLYAFTFYMLSGLHGAHVLGGLIPLGITAVRAGRGRYTSDSHEGVQYVSMYWHFLDGVWLVMFTVLMIAA